MGLLTGNLSFRPYRVVEDLPPDFRTTFLEAIHRKSFRENLESRSAEENVGWVNIADPDDTHLDLNKVLHDHYLVLALRIDKKRVPAKLLAILARRRMEEVREAKGLERLTASHKREIKEAVLEDLLGRALPSVAVYDMAWDINTGRVRIFATSDTLCDLFRVFFEDTFKLHLLRTRPSTWLERAGLPDDVIQDRVLNIEPAHFQEV